MRADAGGCGRMRAGRAGGTGGRDGRAGRASGTVEWDGRAASGRDGRVTARSAWRAFVLVCMCSLRAETSSKYVIEQRPYHVGVL